MEQNQQKPIAQKEKSKVVPIILILMIVLLLGAGGYLGFMYMNTLKKYDGIKVKEITSDSTISKQNIELTNLKVELKALEGAIPGSVADSLYSVITKLEEDLQTAKNNTRVVYTGGGGGGGSKKEIESLKAEIADYQARYNKLLTDLATLKNDKDKLANDVNTLNNEKSDLTNKNKGLQDKVDVAAQLKFYDTEITGYKLDKKGKKTFEEKSKKVTGFDISFKIMENAVAEEGEKMAYIVISGPDKATLAESSANVFQIGGTDKIFSIQKSFYFNNKQASISSEYKVGEPLKVGEYTTEIYIDGKLSGTAVSYIKK